MANLYPVLGAAVALAGADKLVGNRDYAGMFRHLGWSQDGMRAVAAVETVGGLFLTRRSTRRLGAAMVATVSALVLVSELREGETKLAGPRGAILAASLAALLVPGGA